MEKIIAHVCEAHGFEPVALVEPGENRKCSEARATISLLVWHEEGPSLTGFGKRLGRDLSSLGYAVNRLRKPFGKNASSASAFDSYDKTRQKCP